MSSLDIHSAKDPVTEIENACNGGIDKAEKIKKMTESIEKQVAAGKYTSNRLRRGAVDVSS